MDSDTAATTGWASLSLELRQAIWTFAYTTQDARVVEVGTAEHAHYSQDHDWCPRSSPSPRPIIVNVCREARSTGHQVARRSGHLIFHSTRGTCTSDIYFNPEIDTLFVRNDKDYWIRDWGPEGILTQVWKMHHPERLRFLAIELEPLTRATTPWSLHVDLFYFPKLEELMFIVKKDGEEAQKHLRCLNQAQWHLARGVWQATRGPGPKYHHSLGFSSWL